MVGVARKEGAGGGEVNLNLKTIHMSWSYRMDGSKGRDYITCWVVFIILPDFDFRWGDGGGGGCIYRLGGMITPLSPMVGNTPVF